MRRPLAMVIAATALLGVGATATAQDEPEPPAAAAAGDAADAGTVTLELVDQSFDLARNGDIELTYRLTGDLATLAELTPPTTTTTTTTTTPPPTTAPPPTTIAPTSTVAPGGDAAAPPVPAPPTATTQLPETTTTTTEPPPPPVELTMGVLNYAPIDDPAELDRFLGPDPLIANLLQQPVDGLVLDDVRASIDVETVDSATIRLTVPTDSAPSVAERLEFNEDGIHPILVEFRIGDQVVARHGTVVERRTILSTVPPTIDLALIAAVDDPGPSASDETVAEAVSQLDRLIAMTRQIDAAVTLKVPPSVATAAIESGALPLDVRDILISDELLAAPATPFDVSSAVEVDRVDAFRSQLAAGEDDVRDALGIIPVRDVWLATEPLSAAAAQVLDVLGVRYLAMPAEIYRDSIAMDPAAELPRLDRFVDIALPDGSTMPALIIDDEFGAVFDSEATDAVLAEQHPTEWAVQQVAFWRLEQFAEPRTTRREQRSHLFAVPGLGDFDPRLVNALETFAEQTDAIRFSRGSVLASVTDVQEFTNTIELPATAGPSLVERLDRIEVVEADLADTASMLPADDPRLAQWSRRLDSFVSTAFGDVAVFAELDELTEEAARLRGGVIAPEPFTFTLTGQEGSIQLQVGNSLDEPLNVVVRLSSPRLRFPDDEVPLTLPANETIEVDVPVEARSNGTSAVTVEIVTPASGRALIEPVILTARVTTLTGFAQLLTAGLILMLITWWISHWRSKRRDTNGEPEVATTAAE